MSLTLPLRLQLWQSMGEASMTNVIEVSPIQETSPTVATLQPIGRCEMVKSKSTLDTTTKSIPYPTQIESSSAVLSQPSIRRVLSSIDIPTHAATLENANTHATVYTPPSTTRTLISSPSWNNILLEQQQRMMDIRADQHRRRRRGIPRATYLYAGAAYHGTQSVHHAGRDLSWTVHVRMLGLDMRHGMCCGMMEAYDVPGQKQGVVTTYWEGQIIDNINHSFFTGRWDVTCEQDETCWTRFVAFVPLRGLVEQQQPLIHACYPCEEGEKEKNMRKPDEQTAERIYAKLQQLKRLAQQPPPRVECSDDSVFDTPTEITPESSDTSCDTSDTSVDSTPDVTPDVSTAVSSTETSSDDEDNTTEDDITEEDVTNSYDELACIAAHHRLTRHLNRSRYIFMRWKEMSFDAVNTTGLTIAGHYNVVMDRMDGSIIGIFQDQRTCNQRLVLNHVLPSNTQGQSFSEYHFHH